MNQRFSILIIAILAGIVIYQWNELNEKTVTTLVQNKEKEKELLGVINLRLNNNLIEDVTPLTKIAGLEFLYLHNNLIRDALPLLNCESLLGLNIINNKLPLIYGKQKKLFREKFPDASLHWDGRTRTPNLFG